MRHDGASLGRGRRSPYQALPGTGQLPQLFHSERFARWAVFVGFFQGGTDLRASRGSGLGAANVFPAVPDPSGAGRLQDQTAQ